LTFPAIADELLLEPRGQEPEASRTGATKWQQEIAFIATPNFQPLNQIMAKWQSSAISVFLTASTKSRLALVTILQGLAKLVHK